MEREKRVKEPVKKQDGFLRRVKWAAGWCSVLLGTALAVYAGLWLLFAKPLISLYVAYKAGELRLMLIVVTAVKCWLSFTVAGAIWTVGYIGKCMLE